MAHHHSNSASPDVFVENFTIKPYQNGLLDGLTFAVKDNIDLAGHKTSYGSPSWSSEHKAAVYNALCTEQLLGAGATCTGKVIADEYTYSLAGENPFFGTPLNPKAPDRVPGGSSSGSASAVACKLVDFSIGTDSAGSIRTPASFCGVWGMRPTLHRISEAGVLPFMPSVSTVGAFSNDIGTLDKVMRILLSSEETQHPEINKIYILEDSFAIADSDVSEAVRKSISDLIQTKGLSVSSIKLSEIMGEEINLHTCNRQALRILQTAEFSNTVGNWIESVKPVLSPNFSAAYENVQNFDRSNLNAARHLCEKLFNRINHFMCNGNLILFPTTPTIAPLKGSLDNIESIIDFYDRTMAITSFAGLGRLPEISIPAVTVIGVPVGLSLAAGFYQDEFLLSATQKLFGK